MAPNPFSLDGRVAVITGGSGLEHPRAQPASKKINPNNAAWRGLTYLA